MPAKGKWIKYTISGGVACFTITLYLLCMMVPPGVHIEHKPYGGKDELLLNVQKHHLEQALGTNHNKLHQNIYNMKDNVSNLAGFIENTAPDHTLMAKVWPKSNDSDKPVARYTAEQKLGHVKAPGCEAECRRLGNFFGKWPKTKPKALIYYLTRASRLPELKRSLESVDQYFNHIYRYPIVVFHESDLIGSIPIITGWTNSSLYFQLVTFALPEFLTNPVLEDIPCRSTIGYRHMCRFNAKLVYEHPIIQWADYVWRLDDESLLTSTVTYDVFGFMKANGLLYGYIWKHRDSKNCVTNLWNSTKDYIQKHMIPPNAFHQWQSPKLYYNNFEISSMELWRSEHYRSFIDYIDRLGGIYYHRWGDAPIKGIAVSLFVPQNKVHHFKDISYQHNTFSNP